MNPMSPQDHPLPRRHEISPAIIEWIEERAQLGPLDPWQQHLLEQVRQAPVQALPKKLRAQARRPLVVPPPPPLAAYIRVTQEEMVKVARENRIPLRFLVPSRLTRLRLLLRRLLRR